MAVQRSDILFPLGGISRRMGFQNQEPFTCPDMLNCRNEDVFDHRLRGGSRPGLAQILPPRASDAAPDTTVITTVAEFAFSKDTMMRSSAPSTNYAGDNLKIGVGYNNSGDVDRFIAHVDLSQTIPTNATITVATLQLTGLIIIGALGGAAKIKRLNQTAWSESQATWNVYSTGNSWSPVNAANPQTGPYTTPPADVDFNLPTINGAFSITGLAAHIQDAVTSRSRQWHAMFLLADETVSDNHAIAFRSRTYSIVTQRPVLSVTYTVPA